MNNIPANHESIRLVSQYVNSTRNWGVHQLSLILPGSDLLVWNGDVCGKFTMVGVNKSLLNSLLVVPHPMFKFIWQWKGLERLRFFLWKIASNALLTIEARRIRHLT